MPFSSGIKKRIVTSLFLIQRLHESGCQIHFYFFNFMAFQEEAHLDISAQVIERGTGPSGIQV